MPGRDAYQQPAAKFARGVYHARNRRLAELVAAGGPRRIFEFAAGSYDLARLILDRDPAIETYRWSDFAPRCIAESRKILAGYPACTLEELDIDADYAAVDWSAYDTVICVSLEHLARDREILEAIAPQTRVFLSLPRFGAPTHLRWFNGELQIRRRYAELIAIDRIEQIRGGGLRKFLVVAHRP